jgi:hypothetical protein
MEPDPRPMQNDYINRDDPKNYDTITMCYEPLSSRFVASDHVISHRAQVQWQQCPFREIPTNFSG